MKADAVKTGDRVRYWDRQYRWWVRGSLVAMDDPQTAVVLLDSEFRKSSHISGRVLVDLDLLRAARRRRSDQPKPVPCHRHRSRTG
jgi:hypothetical protein